MESLFGYQALIKLIILLIRIKKIQKKRYNDTMQNNDNDVDKFLAKLPNWQKTNLNLFDQI